MANPIQAATRVTQGESSEAEPWTGQPFHAPAALFHDIHPPATSRWSAANGAGCASPARAHRLGSNGKWSCGRPRRRVLQHVFEIAVADREHQISAHRPEDHLGHELPSFERLTLHHRRL